MSNNEMIHAPRELVELALKTIHGLAPDRFSVEAQLRGLLANPATKQQGEPGSYTAADVTEAHSKGYALGMAQRDQCASSDQHQGEPVAWRQIGPTGETGSWWNGAPTVENIENVRAEAETIELAYGRPAVQVAGNGYSLYEAMVLAGWGVRRSERDAEYASSHIRWSMERWQEPRSFADGRIFWTAATFEELVEIAIGYGHAPAESLYNQLPNIQQLMLLLEESRRFARFLDGERGGSPQARKYLAALDALNVPGAEVDDE